MNKGDTTYFKGSKVEFTGNSDVEYGETWHEAVYLEGHKEGETLVVGQSLIDTYGYEAKEK